MSDKNFSDLSKEELINILNQGNLSEEDFANLTKELGGRGMNSFVTVVEDADSGEGKAAIEYIEYHKKIPESYYTNMPEEEVEWSGKILLSENSGIEDKKRALLILAHKGSAGSYKILEEYEKNPDPELKIWLNLAIQECKGFLKSGITGKPVVSVERASKIGRNEKCPCGSGKKYKKCCLGK